MGSEPNTVPDLSVKNSPDNTAQVERIRKRRSRWAGLAVGLALPAAAVAGDLLLGTPARRLYRIPCYDYQTRVPSNPTVAVSRTGILYRIDGTDLAHHAARRKLSVSTQPGEVDRGNAIRPSSLQRIPTGLSPLPPAFYPVPPCGDVTLSDAPDRLLTFQLGQPELENRHIVLSRVTMTVADNGDWIFHGELLHDPLRVPAQDRALFERYKRNHVHLDLRTIGLSPNVEAPATAVLASPQYCRIVPMPIRVERGQVRHVHLTGNSRDMARYFHVLDRIEVRLAWD